MRIVLAAIPLTRVVRSARSPARPPPSDPGDPDHRDDGPRHPATRRARAVTERMNRIRSELAGSRYRVDLDRLAEHIFEDDLERT